MKKRIAFLLIAVMAVTILISGCNANKTPSAVVKDFFNDLKTAKYADAEKLLSAQLVADIKKETNNKTTIQAQLKDFGEMLKSVKFDKVEIVKEEIKGTSATVEFKILLKDDAKNQETAKYNMIKENGSWKIAGTGSTTSGQTK